MRHFYFLALICLVVLISSAVNPVAADGQRQIPASKQQIQLSFAPLVKQVSPAVVNIYTARVVEQRTGGLFDDPFFRRFFGRDFGISPRRRRQNSLGSGVIVAADGLIVTNHHVIKNATEITVALTDRREFKADLVLDDEKTDLAVLRIDPGSEPLPFLSLRNSDDLEVGDLVLAIGNPFNVGQTVTSGIVSALARTGFGVSDLQSFIQTDAAINPGNSGGALVTMDGRLVGVNTAIFSKSGGSLGIGFAVPANMVRVVIKSAEMGSDYVRRPWLGAETQTITSDLADAFGLQSPVGALIADVWPDGPAANAGLKPGDVVAAFNGHAISDPAELSYRMGTGLIGSQAALRVLRQNRALELQLALETAPNEPPANPAVLQGQHPLSGAKVANLSPALVERLGLRQSSRGVIVLDVHRRGRAAQHGFRAGDIIRRINGEEIARVRQIQAMVGENYLEWSFVVRRGDKDLRLRVRG